MAQSKNRIWEIDFIRGIAIILMIIFHLVVDLKDFYSYNLDYLNGFWFYLGKTSAVLFMLVSGVSSSFSRSFKRGMMIFGFGMLLTIITYFYDPQTYIVFGILHLLGVSMILAPFFNQLDKLYIFIIATLVILMGIYFDPIYINTSYLIPIGLKNNGFRSMDYYPLFPWFGVFLYGIIISKVLNINKRIFIFFIPRNDLISYLGRHSLMIYLTHQPVLLAILFLIHR